MSYGKENFRIKRYSVTRSMPSRSGASARRIVAMHGFRYREKLESVGRRHLQICEKKVEAFFAESFGCGLGVGER